MKKFLTVLLVVAVMFTFSFSSMAFATTYNNVSKTGAEVEEILNNAIQVQNEQLKLYKNQALLKLTESAPEGDYEITEITAATDTYYGMYKFCIGASRIYYFSKSAIEAGIDDAIDAANTQMNAAKQAIMDLTKTGANNVDVDVLAAYIEGVVTGTDLDVVYTAGTETSLSTSIDVVGTVEGHDFIGIYDAKTLLRYVFDELEYNYALDTKIDEVQLPLTYKLFSDKLAALAANYPDTGKYAIKTAGTGTSYTARGVLETIVANAQNDMDSVYYASNISYGAKIASLTNIYDAAMVEQIYTYAASSWTNTASTWTDVLKTTAEKEITAAKDAAEVAKEAATLKQDLIAFYTEYAIKIDTTSTKYNLASITDVFAGCQGIYSTSTTAPKDTIFGVEVADASKATKAEAQAVNAAFYAAITSVVDTWTAYADGETGVIPTIHDGSSVVVPASATTAMDRPYVASLGTKAVEEYEANLKAMVSGGTAVYDATKVAAVYAEAKDLVLADVMEGTNKYFSNKKLRDGLAYDAYNEAYPKAKLSGIEQGSYASLEAAQDAAAFSAMKLVADEEDAFKAAVTKAYNKFQTTAVLSGSAKTDDADLVYCEDQYANYKGVRYAYGEIKADAQDAILAAQSYAEIEKALADAKTKLEELAPAKDLAKMNTAKSKYYNALESYSTSVQNAKGDKDKYGQYAAAVATAKENIDYATTYSGIEAAYKAGLTAIDSVITDDAAKAMKKAVETQIDALPYTSQLKATDYDAVMAAYDAYVAYDEATNGTTAEITNLVTLKAKVVKALELKRAELVEAAEAANKEYTSLYSQANLGSEEANAKLAAKKVEYTALYDQIEAYNDLVEDIYDATSGQWKSETTKAATMTNSTTEKSAAYAAEIKNVDNLLLAANKDGATEAQKQAALDAYNALTEYQQMQITDEAKAALTAVKTDIAEAAVENTELTIAKAQATKVSAKSTAGKGYIKITWKLTNGESSDVDGYQVWKSTKKNSGYKKAFTTAKTSYKNTKGLKSGTRYYYKVRSYKVVDGKTYYGSWSNKAYRKAK